MNDTVSVIIFISCIGLIIVAYFASKYFLNKKEGYLFGLNEEKCQDCSDKGGCNCGCSCNDDCDCGCSEGKECTCGSSKNYGENKNTQKITDSLLGKMNEFYPQNSLGCGYDSQYSNGDCKCTCKYGGDCNGLGCGKCGYSDKSNAGSALSGVENQAVERCGHYITLQNLNCKCEDQKPCKRGGKGYYCGKYCGQNINARCASSGGSYPCESGCGRLGDSLLSGYPLNRPAY